MYVNCRFVFFDALSDLGRNLEAIDSNDRSIGLKPDCADAYHNKGVALSDLGRNIEAIVFFDRSISLKPDCADAYYNKGVALSD